MKLRQLLAVTKALSDENRVRMLMAVSGGELCVCQITELFGLSASTTSKHLSILYQAGLLDCRKDGRWAYYSLPDKQALPDVKEVLAWVLQAAEGDSQISEDEQRLKTVIAMDPHNLCKQQCRK
jgi:DNA-binding transcriptional ArsR family regulator